MPPGHSNNQEDLESSNREANDPSPIELLPRELLWAIVEYSPGAVSNLRLASRSLQNNVVEFTQSRINFRLCNEFTFFIRTVNYVNLIQITIEVEREKSALFELLLKQRLPSNTVRQRIQRVHYQGCKQEGRFRTVHFELYTLLFDPLLDSPTIANNFMDCMGNHVDCIKLTQPVQPTIFYRILDKITFKKLDVCMDNVKEDFFPLITRVIIACKVKEVFLRVLRINATEPGKVLVKFLLDLSSLVQNIHIIQPYTPPNKLPIDFLDIKNVDWSETILDMFSRKLNTLQIRNMFYPRCLPLESANKLRKNLPLTKKRIWFQARCVAYCPNGLEETNGEFNISADSGYPFSTLSIKHCTRLREFGKF